MLTARVASSKAPYNFKLPQRATFISIYFEAQYGEGLEIFGEYRREDLNQRHIFWLSAQTDRGHAECPRIPRLFPKGTSSRCSILGVLGRNQCATRILAHDS
jgi:hypothetical protein